MVDLLSYLRSLEGKFIQVEQGGALPIHGRLAAVMADYVVVLAPEPVYCQVHHMGSCTVEPFLPLPAPDSAGETLQSCPNPLPPTFRGIVQLLEGCSVRINTGSLAPLWGVVGELGEDFVRIAPLPQQDVCCPLSGIRNVAPVGMPQYRQDGPTGEDQGCSVEITPVAAPLCDEDRAGGGAHRGVRLRLRLRNTRVW